MADKHDANEVLYKFWLAVITFWAGLGIGSLLLIVGRYLWSR